MPGDTAVDLGAYLDRIGQAGTRSTGTELLGALHAAHLAHIPFENVDVVLGRGVRLDLDAIQEKLVGNGRGGYCFEQNILFSAVLGRLGFDVTDLAGRVRPPGATRVMARSHMLLRVVVDGREWLADVGFGASGPIWPVPMDGTPVRQVGVAYRVGRDGHEHVLQAGRGRAWFDLYSFTLEPAHAADYEQANHFTSTHPSSPFVRGLTVQLSTTLARHTLRGRSYTIQRGEDEERVDLDVARFDDLLVSTFGLRLDAGDRERLIDITWGTGGSRSSGFPSQE